MGFHTKESPLSLSIFHLLVSLWCEHLHAKLLNYISYSLGYLYYFVPPPPPILPTLERVQNNTPFHLLSFRLSRTSLNLSTPRTELCLPATHKRALYVHVAGSYGAKHVALHSTSSLLFFLVVSPLQPHVLVYITLLFFLSL